MASYLETTLSNGESILLETKISLFPYLIRFIFGGLMLVAALAALGLPNSGPAFVVLAVLAVALIGTPLLRYLTNELALTNKRVVARFGIISLSTLEIRLDKIESVSVQQTLFGRLFGYGSVIVRGTGGSQDPMPNIPDPVQFRTKFASALESAQRGSVVTPVLSSIARHCTNCGSANTTGGRFCSNCGTALTASA